MHFSELVGVARWARLLCLSVPKCAQVTPRGGGLWPARKPSVARARAARSACSALGRFWFYQRTRAQKAENAGLTRGDEDAAEAWADDGASTASEMSVSDAASDASERDASDVEQDTLMDDGLPCRLCKLWRVVPKEDCEKYGDHRA